MKKAILLICALCLSSCAVTRKVNTQEIKINFLDEYILPADMSYKGTRVGGLSGIDLKDGHYYLVSDQASSPRIYESEISLKNSKFDSIRITNLIKVQQKNEYSSLAMDLEAIRTNPVQEGFVIASEGMIADGKDPGLFKITASGEIERAFNLPDYFHASGTQQPRTNGVFEGLALSHDGEGYWVATELPLKKDGPKPKIYPTRSHIRVTKFDSSTGEALKQFVYKLDGISKAPINFFAVNGVTEILEYDKDKFLFLERAYSAGYGSHGNTVKIFLVDASNTTNTLGMAKLKGQDYKKARKSLVFNFREVRKKLTDNIIDNIEGMCFGPELPNGNRSLILISDNNFNSFAKQLNQFILLELEFVNENL